LGTLEKLTAEKKISADERVVILNTAAGQKYFTSPPDVPSIDLSQSTDWEQFEAMHLV
jgi:hypothetical protein